MFTSFTLEEQYNLSEKEGIIDLSSACMPAMSLADLLELFPEDRQEKLCSELLTKPLSYSTQFGDQRLRSKLASSLYPNLKANNFLITSGASEAIFIVFNTLFNAGDCIIVQKPIYQSLYQIAEDHGIKIIDWNCDLENHKWHIEELEQLIRSNPECKALVINNPNNPTGFGFLDDELKKIVGLLDGRYLISDEVFRNISLKPISSTIELYEQAIVISDLSKSFSMPGLRIGWIACVNPDLINLFSSYKNYLSLRSATTSELIATWVLEKHKEISKINREILTRNINSLYSSKKSDLFFELNIPRENIMGLSIFPKLKKKPHYQELLDTQKIFIATGEYFAPPYKNYCRIGLGKLELKKLSNLCKDNACLP